MVVRRRIRRMHTRRRRRRRNRRRRGGDPIAVAAAPCAHEENAKANGCNNKGYDTFSKSCIVKFMGIVSSCNEVLSRAKSEYKKDNANFLAVKKGLSEINKGIKETYVLIEQIINGGRAIIYEVMNFVGESGA